MSLDIIARGMAASADTKAQLAVNMIADFPTGLHWKGSCAWSELPSNPEQGDAWTIIDKNNAEYAWNGSEWQRIDTSNVDQSYDPTSENAQSGIAVAEAMENIPLNLENGEGNSTLQQKVDAEGGQPLALGKWSMAEGRGNNLTVKLVSKNLADNQITVAKYDDQGNKINGARDIRANAILWIVDKNGLGAWYYVTNVSKTNPDNILTLDEVERQLKDQDGHNTTIQYLSNVEVGAEIHAYMGAAAASASHIEGNFNNTVWLNSRYEKNEDNVNRSHAEGSRTLVAGYCAHAEGENSRALGNISHAEGSMTQAIAGNSHAEGQSTKSQGGNSHAEGEGTTAAGDNSHAEGSGSYAGGVNSHAGGYHANANGAHSFAHGYYVTAANGLGQTVVGKYNDNKGNTLFEVGNGSADDARSNAFEVNTDNSVTINGNNFIVNADDSIQFNNKKIYNGELASSQAIDTALNAGFYKVGFKYDFGADQSYGQLLVIPYFGSNNKPFGAQVFYPNGDNSVNKNNFWYRTCNGWDNNTDKNPRWNAWVKYMPTNTLSKILDLTFVDGYYSNSGELVTTGLTHGEKTSNKFEITPNLTYKVNLSYSETRAMWIGITYWDTNEDFISRWVPVGDVNQKDYFGNFYNIPSNAVYAAVSFRGYDESVAYVRAESDDLYNVILNLSVDQTYDPTSTNAQSGIAVAEAVEALTGSSAPTTSTVGYIGQFYIDTTNSKVYQCIAITPQGTTPETYTYTWQAPPTFTPSNKTGTTAPTTATVADYIGQLYVATTANETLYFKCVDISGSTYTWKRIYLEDSTAGIVIGNPRTEMAGTINIGEAKTASSGTAGRWSVCVGYANQCRSLYGLALVGSCGTGDNTIQIGRGFNSTAHTMSVGLDADRNYRLLEADGTIPNERIKGIVYTDYQTMITDFNSLSAQVYHRGHSIYLEDKNMPDLWIKSENESSSVPYDIMSLLDTKYTTIPTFVSDTYYSKSGDVYTVLDTEPADWSSAGLTTYYFVNNDTFISTIRTNGYVQIGYYIVEFQKSDVPVKNISAAGNALTPDANGNWNIPKATSNDYGLVAATNQLVNGIAITNDGYLILASSTEYVLTHRASYGTAIKMSMVDDVVKRCLTDGLGTAWTDTERLAALLRMGCTVDDDPSSPTYGCVKWTAQTTTEE